MHEDCGRAGIAPRILYASIDDQLLLTEFIEADAFPDDVASEDAYLDAYFDDPVSQYACSRYYLMRVLLHVFAAALVLPIAVRAGVHLDADADVPAFREFHRRLIGRQIPLAEAEAKRDYGLVHFREAAHQMRSDRFSDALATLSHGSRAIS